MARKRTKANEEHAEQPAETGTAIAHREPDVFDEQAALRQAEQAQRDAEQRAAEAATEQPHTSNGHSARHAQHREHGQSHADAVGKRQPRYNEQGKTDYVVGVRLLEHHEPYLSIIRFDEKPSDAVREKLQEAGFRWSQQNKEWSRPISYETRIQDRVSADRVFEEVTKAIREERGITHDYGTPG